MNINGQSNMMLIKAQFFCKPKGMHLEANSFLSLVSLSAPYIYRQRRCLGIDQVLTQDHTGDRCHVEGVCLLFCLCKVDGDGRTLANIH